MIQLKSIMEESFPRGGTLFSKSKRAKTKPDEENLFKVSVIA